jgi:hypothetical protein
LSATTVLFAYRAITDGRRLDWLALGISLGALALTAYSGLILVALVILCIVFSRRGRARLGTIGPWAAIVIAILINFPQLVWLERTGANPLPALEALPSLVVAERKLLAWGDLLLWLVFAHAGLVVLLLVAGGVLSAPGQGAPAFERPQPVEPFAKKFIYTFALAPAFIATLLAVLLGRSQPVGGAAPLVILSGLAIVVAAGDTIRLHRQRIGALVWLGLLVVPPAMVVGATVTLPWTAAIDLEVSKPAAQMGDFFTETFRRRTGRPLEIVVGDQRTAGLVALTSPDRPSLFIDGSPERAPWLSETAVRQKGAVVLWTATDAAGTPPANLKERFPDMVTEVPRSFSRSVQGRLPLLRIGWAVIRPAQ